MKTWRIILTMTAAVLSLASCSSDPEYADPEAHEKTVALNEQYAPLMIGTWHYEKTGDTQRYFEELTFRTDGTLTGTRKWQVRKLVTIGGEQQYTDWEDLDPLVGAFTGEWKLSYWSPEGQAGQKRNILQLTASYDDGEYMGTPRTWTSAMPTPPRSASRASTSGMPTDGSTSSAVRRSLVSER